MPPGQLFKYYVFIQYLGINSHNAPVQMQNAKRVSRPPAPKNVTLSLILITCPLGLPPLLPPRLLLLPLLPPPRAHAQQNKQHRTKGEPDERDKGRGPAIAPGIDHRVDDGRHAGAEQTTDEIEGGGHGGGLAGRDVDDEDLDDLEETREAKAEEEEQDEGSRDGDFGIQHPPVDGRDEAAEVEEWEQDLEAGAFDGEVGKVLLLVFLDRHAETLGMAAVVVVDGVPFAIGDGGQNTAGADGDEAQAEYEVVVVVDGGELRRDGRRYSVVASVDEAGIEEDEHCFLLGDDAERAERVGEVNMAAFGQSVTFLVVGRTAGFDHLALV